MKYLHCTALLRQHGSFGGQTPKRLLIELFAVGLACYTQAQTFSNVPIVSIQATDPIATWAGDTGTFTISRRGDTNLGILVFYSIGGTASNGVDYAMIQNRASLPSGVVSTSVVINPINLGQTSTKTVTLHLEPSPLANPLNNYFIGFPGSATVYITTTNVVVTNPPPPFIVRMTSPPNGAIFRAPVDIPLSAYARPTSGPPVSVEFFENGNSLGLGHPIPSTIGASNTFALIWSNAPAGNYALTAKGTDTNGNTAVSAPVNISVLPSPPPPTNRPPIVTIVASAPVAIEGTNCWPWLGLGSGTLSWSNWWSPTNVFRFFTNCGPKDAVFTVRRFGATNDAVTVDYAIGGTASNGVDYATLSGTVTIPAGQRAAMITVTPIDDGQPDITSTVILRLKPSPTTNYVVGFPAAAGAIILDAPTRTNSAPTAAPIGSAMLAGNTFHLNASGPDGAWFSIQYSSDLSTWTSICTNQVVNGSIDFVDPDSQTDPVRFYRAVPELSPPAQ